MGVGETQEEQRLRTVGGQGVLLGPQHGELLGRAGRLESFGKGRRGGSDSGYVGVTLFRYDRQGGAGPTRPSGAQFGGKIGGAFQSGGAHAQRADEVSGSVTEIDSLLVQTADGGVEGDGRSGAGEFRGVFDRLGLLGDPLGGGQAQTGQGGGDLAHLRGALIDNLLGANLDLLGGLGKTADLRATSHGGSVGRKNALSCLDTPFS